MTIGSGLDTLNYTDAFYCCNNVETINVKSGNGSYCSDDGVLYDKNKTTLVKYPPAKSGTSFTIPSTVTTIADYAFYSSFEFNESCNITSITIPSSVTWMGRCVFGGCSKLTSATILGGISTLRDSTFYACYRLESVTLPSTLATIESGAFYGTPLSNVFVYSGCSWDVSNYSSVDISGEANIWRYNEATDQTGVPAGKTLVDVTSKYRGSSGDKLACNAMGSSFVIGSVPSGKTLTHSYGTPSYTWSSDNIQCTATRTCSDCGATESQTVNTTNSVTAAATCTSGGTRTYTATFSNSAFATQTKDENDIPALGHSWSALSYEWSNNYDQCTATRVCTRDAGHTVSKTVNTTYEVTQEPTQYVSGELRLVADFSKYFGEGAVVEIPKVELLPARFYNVDVYWENDMMFVFDNGRFDTDTGTLVSSFGSTGDMTQSMGEKDAATGEIKKWYGFDGVKNRIFVLNRSNQDIKVKYDVPKENQCSGISLELYDYEANNSQNGYQVEIETQDDDQVEIGDPKATYLYDVNDKTSRFGNNTPLTDQITKRR